ncbi:DUF2635 domain-containing protein [Pectobacteriaceae bacterium C52]|uniref:DUF2635 domain-containing protein n=1 Tax=Brenneria uluponensis TaxID=3057057 RepID=UPI0028E3C575|nr:DUF2635 domain-containing protein [Brenneria ulupoensis]WJV61356.1 DUF2635 domain-containing protein [Pectobacteriaceae bacterium C52]WJY13606.1 DUF2635 domain-containing protein [Pectobacteriaceae bacterium CE90]WJY16355.1 DUF2635 domain-containing protein [Pectobacteriaceae bacterium CE90]
MFVKPKDGRSVPDPARSDLLPADGRNVIQSGYWQRRIEAGDVEVVDRTATNTKKSEVKNDG